jgi:TPR repeat protein
MRIRKVWLCLPLACGLIAPAARAQGTNDARFYGTWTTSFVVNGQRVTMISVHDPNGGYTNSLASPTGNVPAGTGTFFASNGKYQTSAPSPNDAGVYHFTDANTVVCTNAAGQTAVWIRNKSPQQAASGGGQPAAVQPAAAQPAPYVPDPSLPASTNAAIEAFNRKDYNTAWKDFMVDAQKGNSEAEAGVGAMLFNHVNPPGTGYWAQCEKWLLASANQGNTKGMDFLGQYYYQVGKNEAGGINPDAYDGNAVSRDGRSRSGVSASAPQQQINQHFALARQWFEKASAKNDAYAMGNLAILLDAGVGGPADPTRAAQLRERVKQLNNTPHGDTNFVRRATGDPAKLAMDASWQSGNWAQALQRARDLAAKGDATGEAMLARAYYQGLGVDRNYATASSWAKKATAQNSADGIFFLGLMTEWGRGVQQNVDSAQKLFDRAAALGQPWAAIEAKGMRMEGEAAAMMARYRAACQRAGGVIGPEGVGCEGPLGGDIDPYY